jgi:hypothetical protein
MPLYTTDRSGDYGSSEFILCDGPRCSKALDVRTKVVFLHGDYGDKRAFCSEACKAEWLTHFDYMLE